MPDETDRPSIFVDNEVVIWAVVVSYNPEPTRLKSLIEVLAPQVERILVVDNASTSDICSLLANLRVDNVSVTALPENLGIAAAQNAGIEEAMRCGATFIYLSDQDSLPSSSMIAELLRVLTAERVGPVAAVGPATIDERTGHTSFFVVERSGLPRRWLPPSDCGQMPKDVGVAFLIASGTLLSVDVIKHIGGMRSRYFIDHVDTEWCFRARAAGYALLGVPDAKLVHRLGDAVKRVWFFRSRQVMYHSPLRDYYMFRNTLLMLRDVPMSWVWRAHLLWRLVQFASYFLVFTEDRTVRLKRMALGLLHGFRDQGGRLEPETCRCSVLPVSPLEPR